MIVISNSTPLIGLTKIGHLYLLQELFNTIIIPSAVYEEVVVQASGRPGSSEISTASWVQTEILTDRAKVDYLRADLDWGEAEVLVLAEELNADWVLLDEPKARLAAQLLGLKFIGTVGLLLLAKQRNKVTSIRPLLDHLKRENFHLSEKVYQVVLQQAGE